MAPQDSFDRIIEALHQAALDAARWPVAEALIEAAADVGITSLTVGEGGLDDEARIHFAGFYRRGERRPDLEQAFFRIYESQQVRVPRLRRLPSGRLTHVPDLYSETELKTSAVYNEALPLLGGQDGLAVRFDGPDGLHIVWGIGSPIAAGGWQPDRLKLVESLMPHVRHFVVVRQALAAADASDAGLAGLLDNGRLGVVQLDRSGRLLAANDPALAVLRRADGLLDTGGTLHAWLPADHERLQKALGRALPTLWGQPPAGASMTLQRRSGGAALGVHISPVGNAQTDFGARRVAALVLVVDPTAAPRIDPVRVSEVFGLTPAESRVAALLAEGRPVSEIVAVTGNRQNYVRTILKRVYRKQEVSGQLALMHRILALEDLPRR